MAFSAVIGNLAVNLALNTAAFQEGATYAQKQAAAFGKKLQGMGNKMSGFGKSMSLRVTAPVVAFGTLTLKAAGDFEQAMNQVAAVSGATGADLASMRDMAKQLGATTQYSASQAADAMNFLAMAGLKTNEILEAMPGTLKLAAAAQLDMGRAADIVTNILSGYNMDVTEVGRAGDVLSKAFTSANTDLSQLAEAMKYAGPVASAAGVNFEEAAAALSLMGNAGIQGSMAGTSLRGAISRILSPTKAMATAMREAGLSFTDANGRLLPLADIVEQLQPHAEDAGLFMELFGQRAGPAMAALVTQGADAVRELRGELENSGGTAERLANVQMEGFNGAMMRMKSAFEATAIAIAESGLIEWATRAVEKFAQWLQTLSETDKQLLKWGVVIAGVAAAIGPVLVAVGSFISILGTLAPLLIKLAPLIKGLTLVLFGLGKALVGLAIAGGPITIVIAAVGALYLAWKNWDKIEPIVRNLYNAVKRWIVDRLNAVWDSVKGKIDAVTGWFKGMYEAVVGNSYVPDMVDGIGHHIGRLDDLMVDPVIVAADAVSGAFDGMASSVEHSIQGIVRALGSGDLKSAAGGLLDILGGSVSGGSKWANLGKSILGGFFANGGTPPMGKVSVVGERGPELFVPRTRGTIIPNHELGGGGGTVINVDARGTVSPQAVQQAVIEGVAHAMQYTDRSFASAGRIRLGRSMGA